MIVSTEDAVPTKIEKCTQMHYHASKGSRSCTRCDNLTSSGGEKNPAVVTASHYTDHINSNRLRSRNTNRYEEIWGVTVAGRRQFAAVHMLHNLRV